MSWGIVIEIALNCVPEVESRVKSTSPEPTKTAFVFSILESCV